MERIHRSELHARTPGDTERAAAAMTSRLTEGACVALVGPLGAGKTVFVKGACRGLGVDDDVLSPTFILYEAFDGRLPVVHVDLYRLEHETEIEDLGVFELIGGDTVILAEWANRSDALMGHADIVVEIVDEGDGRCIQFEYTDALRATFEGMDQWL